MRFLTVLLLLTISAQGLTWQKVQESPDYQKIREDMAAYLPDLAIPRIQSLLRQADLDATAKSSLLTLLGEAKVRAGLPNEAIATLSDPSLKAFSPAHFWKGHAHVMLGHYQDAIDTLKLIDRKSMLEEASLQIGILEAALGNRESAMDRFTPLKASQNPGLVREASFRLVSLSLQEGNIKNAEEILATIKPEGMAEEGLTKYLQGQLQLAKKDRIAAVGTFQTLVNTPIEDLKLPGPIFDAATLALADSLALDQNYGPAITSLLETLEKYPSTSRIAGIFDRLDLWSSKSPSEHAPLILKLTTWMPNAVDGQNTFGLLDGKSAGNFSVSSSPRSATMRSLYSLHLVASINLRSPDVATRTLALKQFSQLHVLSGPKTKNLVEDSLLLIGLAEMNLANYPRALQPFELLRDFADGPKMKALASALVGQASLALKEPEKAGQAFIDAKDLAKKAGDEELELISSLNAGVAMLATGRSKSLDTVTENLSDEDAKAFLLLEKGLSFADKENPNARDLLKKFLTEYPENPRHDEAALALSESAFTPPVDPILAQSLINSLKFNLESQPQLLGRQILVLLELNQGFDQATEFQKKLPDHPLSPRILFQTGQANRRIGEIGKAYLNFENFLKYYPAHELHEAARFLSALSAAASGTESAEIDALERYKELIKGKGILAYEAAIARSSLLIDGDLQEKALEEIDVTLADEKLPDTDRYRLLILAADASGQLSDYPQALEFYETLLKLPELPIAWANRAYFHRGQIFERLDKNKDALESYLTVVNREIHPEKTNSLEWKWFDKCGIDGALTLLEKLERWDAAINLANKLARSGSPRAQDAAASAKRISLDNHRWEAR